MRTLEVIKSDHEMYVATLDVPDFVEVVYSAVEYDTLTKDNAVSIVCYRTKDGMTHQAKLTNGDVFVRRSVSKY